MTFVRRLQLRRQEKALDRLQREYHEGGTKSDAVIQEYLIVLERARALYERDHPVASARRLHVGSGGHRIRGWINIDMVPDASVDILASATDGLPFLGSSIDFIHSEDFLEHVDLEQGRGFLTECYRVLKPGGIVRILTPDLRAIVERVYRHPEARHLRWCERDLGASGPCQALNAHMRMNGDHRFLYDEAELGRVLRNAGFEPRRTGYNDSRAPALRYLDLRNLGLSLYMEGVKPS